MRPKNVLYPLRALTLLYLVLKITWNYLKLAYNYCLLCTKVRSKALVYYPVLKLAYNYCLLCTKMPKSPIKINNSKQYTTALLSYGSGSLPTLLCEEAIIVGDHKYNSYYRIYIYYIDLIYWQYITRTNNIYI